MMIVQEAPNTQPGGVQGALLRRAYHSDLGPLPPNKLPIPMEPKFNIKNIIKKLF